MVNFTITGGEIVPEIEMESWETIFDLKSKIEDKLDVSMHRQSLWYNDRELIDDDRTVRGYDFLRDATLMLIVEPLPPHLKLHVLVKHFGGNGYVRVKETDKVSDLHNKVSIYWGILPNSFSLHRHNVKLEDNHPLRAYYINEASEIKLSVMIEPR
ncbi:Ubiquitin-like domain superfamily [Sesbania bispinosa]|nr:Ubiquitin-like domain superfamily [Sesbania bispinosa]